MQLPRWLAAIGFRRQPIVAGVLVTVAIIGWLLVGTEMFDPIVDSDTMLFVRDGLVRWPLAVVCFVALLLLGRRWGVTTLGLPKRPPRLPWATAALAVGCLILLTPITQFWSHGGYTAAVLFSEMATGVVEELAFRGVVFCGMVAGFGRTPRGVRAAFYGSTLLFGIAHAFGGVGAIIVTTILGGLFMASTLELRSLWPAALLHGFLDVGVNGPDLAPERIDEDWAENLLVVGDMVLFVGSVAALVAWWWWKHWPVLLAEPVEQT